MTSMNLDFTIVINALPYLWQGMKYTLQLTATSAVGGLFFGTLLALAHRAARAVHRFNRTSAPAHGSVAADRRTGG